MKESLPYMKKPSKHLEEETLSTESIFQGKVVSLQIDKVRLPDGKTATREIIRHPGAVAVLAIKDDRIILVDQYRQAMGRCELEIPAGKLEPGEDPMEAAKRELVEETGYTCGPLELLHSFYTSPGFADEVIHLYVAHDLQEGDAAPDEDEFVELLELTMEETLEAISQGRISDAKTLMAVYAWNLNKLTGEFRV